MSNIETRPWGTFEVLYEAPGIKVKRLTVSPGKRLSLQRHKHRKEFWQYIKATNATFETYWPHTKMWSKHNVVANSTESISEGVWHRVENISGELEIIEIQTGSYLGEDDIERMADDYGRV